MSDHNFVNWLETQMRREGWSRAELARRAGLDRAVISRVLHHVRNPAPKTLWAIADGLNLPVSIVFEKAGLLPPAVNWRDLLKTLVAVTSTLPLTEQEGILEYAKMRQRLAKRNSKSPSG